MAVPHYTFLVLKMPGPNRIITVKGSFELSVLCDKEFHKMAQNFGMMATYGEPKDKAKSATTGAAQQLEGHPAELEVKKLAKASSPINIFDSRASSPPHASCRCTQYSLRISDLEGRLSLMKRQAQMAINKASKSCGFMKQISKLEDKVSGLTTQIVHLEECDSFLVGIVESACEMLRCKIPCNPPLFPFYSIIGG
jgi:hypothetical protein